MILVFGTICLDRVRRIDRYPEVGTYAEVRDESLILGGEAVNTACALHLWGAEYGLYGNGVGEGAWGELLAVMLRERGLRMLSPLDSRSTAPVCDIYVSDDGHRTMFGLGFKNLAGMIDLDRIPYTESGWFTVDSNFGEVSRFVVRRAKKAGMRVYAMDLYRDDEPLGAGDVWQGSTDVVGRRDDPEENLQWVAGWVARYGCTTILTDGPHGLVYGAPGQEPTFIPSFMKVQVVDSTGAGDAFRAGMLFGLHAGWDVARTLRFAMASGALSCRTLGASTGAAPLDELELAIR
ncbi:MAG: carbohydrate kinase family protein [Fimbriimonadaceae bacterium]